MSDYTESRRTFIKGALAGTAALAAGEVAVATGIPIAKKLINTVFTSQPGQHDKQTTPTVVPSTKEAATSIKAPIREATDASFQKLYTLVKGPRFLSQAADESPIPLAKPFADEVVKWLTGVNAKRVYYPKTGADFEHTDRFVILNTADKQASIKISASIVGDTPGEKNGSVGITYIDRNNLITYHLGLFPDRDSQGDFTRFWFTSTTLTLSMLQDLDNQGIDPISLNRIRAISPRVWEIQAALDKFRAPGATINTALTQKTAEIAANKGGLIR